MRRLSLIALLLLSSCIKGHEKPNAHKDPECTISTAPPIEGGQYISIHCSKGTAVTFNNDPANGYIYWHRIVEIKPQDE